MDYISALDVDSVWLSPFYLGGGLDFGYDVVDHEKVDPDFGTMEQLEELLKAFEKRGECLLQFQRVENWIDSYITL